MSGTRYALRIFFGPPAFDRLGSRRHHQDMDELDKVHDLTDADLVELELNAVLGYD